jgi:P-type Cu2+ transporter
LLRAPFVTLSSATTWGGPARGAPLAADRTACLHCGLPVDAGAGARFCCDGCEAVWTLLRDEGLSRYYELGGGEGNPVTTASAPAHLWLTSLEEGLARAEGLHRVTLDVQGLHCSACVWLIERVFEGTKARGRVLVNPAVGRCELLVPKTFDLRAFVGKIERFGYRLGPHLKAERAVGSDLVWRLGLCVAIAMNTMIFGIAIYAGLSEGPLFRTFHALNFALSFVSVAIGGPVFFRSAWRAVRRGVLHLDLPISLGILLAFGASALSFAVRHGETSYFDTLNVFIALMLAGRYVQERVLEKNRRYVLASDGAEGLLTRVTRDGRVSIVRCSDLAAGDDLLLARGDLVPVDATLRDDEVGFSLDWINGESDPRTFRRGDVVPAGAFCVADGGARLTARTDLAGSPLTQLLATTRPSEPRAAPFWQALSKLYVVGVLGLATLAFVSWAVSTHDLTRALDVTAAILIVTCPCAFGIATPIAQELALTRLRRRGLFVRTADFFDRALGVRRVVFDKTGTLTTGRLGLACAQGLDELASRERDILYSLACRSAHPKADAVRVAAEAGATLLDLDAREHAGRGVSADVDGATYRLGALSFAISRGRTPDGDVAFTRGGASLASFTTRETLRADARREIAQLEADGYDVSILSGDESSRVREAAESCGVAPERAFGAADPNEKARWIRERGGADVLFVGDGINDALAADAALVSGTPAIDRPFLASKADFYFITPGLSPIGAALAIARRLRVVVRRNLAIALAYNAVAVSLAFAGLMSPLLAAVLMPVSSITTVLATVHAMRERAEAKRWRS